MAEGAHLSLEECIVLNGMETLNSLKREKDIAHCAFIAIPPVKTAQASTLIGRNYDFPPPYGDCAKHIVVTVLKEENKVTTAIIGMPGQIYCPTCINREGLFLELNNGMPSGGYEVDYSRKSLLICLLEVLQDSSTIEQLRWRLSGISADYSLIVNAATADNAISFEFSSTLGHQEYQAPPAEPFVSTNYFQSSKWSDIPFPTDDSTWHDVTRRENLLNLANTLPAKATILDLMAIMNQEMNEGGARWELTIYQIVFDTNNSSLYICRPNASVDRWTYIDLAALFEF
jgi:hypothetical protein